MGLIISSLNYSMYKNRRKKLKSLKDLDSKIPFLHKFEAKLDTIHFFNNDVD